MMFLSCCFRRVLQVAVVLGMWCGLALSVAAQPYLSGHTYFGRSNYIEYIAGDLPIIISAPHGGSLQPAEIPMRTYGTFATDTNTEDLVRKVRTEIQNLTGHVPHIIICRLDRDKIDCNRDIIEGAQGDPEAEIAWNEFHHFINSAKSNAVALHGAGFYIDLHGHGHAIQRLELGYLLSSGQLGLSDATLNSATYENQSSIRTLSQQSILSFPALLRGGASFGAMMMAEGFPAVPSPDMPNPGGDPYFNGGYNTVQHSSVNGGTISGLQIESNWTGVRDTSANRTAFAQAQARVLESYFATHYNINLRTCLPKVWDVGSGNWSSTGSWADNALPASSNHIVFVGSGGSSSHNLSALAAGNGVISSITFSNAASGSYTISGNNISLIGGITNNSAFGQTINNNVIVSGNRTFLARSNSLVFGGNITSDTHLTFAGDQNITVNGALSGVGAVAKSGAGTLLLTSVNSYTGATTVGGGVFQISSTATFGDGTGSVNWLGGTVALSATRDTTSGVIGNPIIMSGDTVIQNTTTAGNGTRNFPFGTDSILTFAGTLTVRNISAANVNTMNLRLQGAGFEFSQSIVFDNSLAANPNNNTVQLDCYNTNGTQIFSGPISGEGRVRRGVLFGENYGTTIFTGDNTYTGGTTINAGTLLVNNTSGSGTGTGTVTVNASGVLGGTGSIAGPVVCTGTIAPGESPGALTLGGGLDMSGGGTLNWELAALSTASTNYDQLVLTNGSLALGGSAKLQIEFSGTATEPDAGEPFWQGIRSWKIMSLSGSATNSGATSFPTILNPAGGTGSFTNYADAEGNVWLSFIPAHAFNPPVIDPKITGAGAGNGILSWTGVEGQTYQVQFKDDLNAPVWETLGQLVATNRAVSFVDTNSSPQRFYRVVIP